ncbi:MAG: mechanosensitive ion channel domain-containing protein [Prolixibacteraceae bacterium]
MENSKDFLVEGASIVLGVLLAFYIYRFLRKFVKRQRHEHIWLRLLKKMIVPLGVLITITFISVSLPLTKLPFDVHILISIGYTIVIAWILIIGIAGIRMIVMARYDIAVADNLKARKIQTQLVVVERVLTSVVVLIAFSIILLTFPKIRQVGLSLLASAGIAGIIIGFAAQQSLSMFLAGFQIAFTQPIRIDDVVIVENEWGRIEEITLTYVVIRIWDQRRLIVPVNYFITKPFQNWSRTTTEILGTAFIYVDYGFPVEAMRQELNRVIPELEEWDKKVCNLQVTDIKQNVVELRVLVSSSNSSLSWDLRVRIRELMLTFVQQNYPQYFPRTRILFNPGKEQEKARRQKPEGL